MSELSELVLRELRTGTQRRILVMLPEKQDRINLTFTLDTEGDIKGDPSRRTVTNATKGNKAFILSSEDTEKGVLYGGYDEDVYYSNARGVQAHTGIFVDPTYSRWHRKHCLWFAPSVRLGADPQVIWTNLHLPTAS